jgi:hypothetical protein
MRLTLFAKLFEEIYKVFLLLLIAAKPSRSALLQAMAHL